MVKVSQRINGEKDAILLSGKGLKLLSYINSQLLKASIVMLRS